MMTLPTAEPMPGPAGLDLHVDRLEELPVDRVYELLALRVAVFVVEQECAYQELDGRDLEPGARHLSLVDPGSGVVAAYLRCLDDDVDGTAVTRIGRVVTHPDYRGQGLARWLLDQVLVGLDRPVVLDAQAHLAPFYRRAGFRLTGPGWIEDGIPHVPMRHDPNVATPS